jgi:hypothetical protein
VVSCCRRRAYGQKKDCLIRNFVSTNTREGRVLQKLFQRLQAIEEDLDPHRTGKIFNVLGDIFPANQLERMVRDMYAPMANLKPWYKVVTPREDLREGKPLDASE